jgi:hypothetical protein
MVMWCCIPGHINLASILMEAWRGSLGCLRMRKFLIAGLFPQLLGILGTRLILNYSIKLWVWCDPKTTGNSFGGAN